MRRSRRPTPSSSRRRRRGIPVILRPVVLAKLMDGYTTLMVTGTHGKTTTTSMLIVALQHSGFDPSFAVGGDLGEAGTNAHHGSGDCFVAEADESDGSLLEYTPNVAVVTNIEADHLDFFGSPEAYSAVFDEFVERLAPGGALVACADDPGAAALAERTAALGIRVLRYGSDDRPRPGRQAGELGAAGHRRGRARRAGRRTASAGDATGGAGQAYGAQRARRAAGGDGGRRARRVGARRAGRIRGGAPSIRAGRHRARRAGVRRLRPPPDRGARRARRGADGDRAERAAAVRSVVFQPHLYSRTADFRAGVRAGAGLRRRGVRARRVRRAGTADGGRQRGDSGRTRRASRCTTCRTSPPSPSRWPTRCARAMSSSRWARATSRCSVPRSSRRLRPGPTARCRNASPRRARR